MKEKKFQINFQQNRKNEFSHSSFDWLCLDKNRQMGVA